MTEKMDDIAKFECWAWISKRNDDYESIIFDATKFKKRKKRWITVYDNSLIYSKTTKKNDMKHVQLEHMTAIKTFNESNLEVSPVITILYITAQFYTTLICTTTEFSL
jgi:hypothetical protein